MIGAGAMSDPYIPLRENLDNIRACLEIIEKHGFGLAIQTKSSLILRDNNIQTIVWLSPILPFINDTKENLLGLLNCCIEAKVYGILCFEMGVTLREGDREYFYKNLDNHFPEMKEKYQKRYGNSYIATSDNNAELMDLFNRICAENTIVTGVDTLFNHMRLFEERNTIRQLELF